MNQRGEKNPFYGKRHTEETRQKMREAQKCRWEQHEKKKSDNGYKMLIIAIIRQAVKDGARDFFGTETGKGYCAMVGINPVKLMEERV